MRLVKRALDCFFAGLRFFYGCWFGVKVDRTSLISTNVFLSMNASPGFADRSLLSARLPVELLARKASGD